MNGITGSTRTDVGILFEIRVFTAFSLSDDKGAFGSRIFARSSLSVVMVKETVEEAFFSKSISLTTILDFVII